MAAVKDIQNEAVSTPGAKAPVRDTQAEATPVSPAARKGLGGFFKSLFKALRSRKKQVSSQRDRKTAQDWRDELQAKHPWWGGGL